MHRSNASEGLRDSLMTLVNKITKQIVMKRCLYKIGVDLMSHLK